ncbi:type II toxin-antitoxin system RelE/ParE family toxin [Polyangium sp. 6x1]|uniref:type II toxin-antitoxin system RelE/ParE family toxin n=1 Tax=Polyangium sp. 6x1 TaxID=3042689 RepID=UPI0024829057|nr:type II toxin-antitoxin system RelE/ParE family toxin [Polyangium sp. 6x1]MDI1449605.1 type II toxin-antitoxin system RelE/ParE family toxin [Polyangium sp. 6x1]
MRVELHPEARAELRATAIWYEEQRPELGDELLAEVSSTLDRITEAPTSFPVWPGTPSVPGTIRRAVLERFPYVVAFEMFDDHLLVLAVAHAKRRPLYWLRRAF